MRKESERNRELIIKPPVFAHRGASLDAPENTMVAFLTAKMQGARWLEFDVMLSADQQAVVIHDETLDRTTDGSGYVCDYPYSYLRTLDAGSWFRPEFAGQHIPLFQDVIHFLRDHQMGANVEIKAMPGHEEQAVKVILHEIEQHWTRDMLPPLISSFSLDALYAVRKHNSHCWLGLLLNEWRADWQQISDELGCVSVHLNKNIALPDRVAAIKATGRSVFCYTVNEVSEAQLLFSRGVDAIYSDAPARYT